MEEDGTRTRVLEAPPGQTKQVLAAFTFKMKVSPRATLRGFRVEGSGFGVWGGACECSDAALAREGSGRMCR